MLLDILTHTHTLRYTDTVWAQYVTCLVLQLIPNDCIIVDSFKRSGIDDFLLCFLRVCFVSSPLCVTCLFHPAAALYMYTVHADPDEYCSVTNMIVTLVRAPWAIHQIHLDQRTTDRRQLTMRAMIRPR